MFKDMQIPIIAISLAVSVVTWALSSAEGIVTEEDVEDFENDMDERRERRKEKREAKKEAEDIRREKRSA